MPLQVYKEYHNNKLTRAFQHINGIKYGVYEEYYHNRKVKVNLYFINDEKILDYASNLQYFRVEDYPFISS